MYKAAIFDLDGTLCDTVNTIAYYGNRALEKFGFEPIETEKFKYFAGDGADLLIYRMLAYRGMTDRGYAREVLKYYKADYETDSLYLTEIFEGINDVLAEMKKQGMKIGVVSNKPHGAVSAVLSSLFEEGTFDGFTGMKEGTIKKPAPYEVLELAEKFGADASECIYIGDTNVDMQTGKNANMYTVGVLWGFREYDELEENGADIIIKEPKELIEIIKKEAV